MIKRRHKQSYIIISMEIVLRTKCLRCCMLLCVCLCFFFLFIVYSITRSSFCVFFWNLLCRGLIEFHMEFDTSHHNTLCGCKRFALYVYPLSTTLNSLWSSCSLQHVVEWSSVLKRLKRFVRWTLLLYHLHCGGGHEWDRGARCTTRVLSMAKSVCFHFITRLYTAIINGKPIRHPNSFAHCLYNIYSTNSNILMVFKKKKKFSILSCRKLTTGQSRTRLVSPSNEINYKCYDKSKQLR